MGAWNYGVFDDDIAYDALDDLRESLEIITDMEKYFDAVIGAEYVEYDEGCYALVSAAVIDSVFNEKQYRCDDEDYFEWVKTLKSFDFTYAEKEIVKYFLNQKEEIARQSTREISKRLYCSPSSIIRLCQKLGFTGFEEFKEMYVEELHYLNSNFSDINPSIPFMTEDNIQTISNKMCSLYHEIIDDTHSLLDHDMLRKSLNLLKNNKIHKFIKL